MKRFPGRFFCSVLFLVVALLTWWPPAAVAREKCKQIVHYDRNNFTLKFTGVKPVELSIGKEATALQVASDLTQIFDEYRIQTCDLLNRFESNGLDKPEIQDSLEAAWRLATLMAVMAKTNGKLTDDDKAGILDSVTTGKTLLSKLSNPQKKQQIPLTSHYEAASPEFQAAIINIKKPAGPTVCLGDLVRPENKEKIFSLLTQGLQDVARNLNFKGQDDLWTLRGHIFTLCTDNRLSPVPGLITEGINPHANPEDVPRIALNYGFVGVAYATGKPQNDTLPELDEVVSFHNGDKNREEQMRRVLIEPDQKDKVNAKWIIAVPLKFNGQVVGVMSISSKSARNAHDVDAAYLDGGLSSLGEKIASLLVAGKPLTPASQVARTQN